MDFGIPRFSFVDAIMMAYNTSLDNVSLETSQHGSAGDSRPTEE
jgi:hypothetical protein